MAEETLKMVLLGEDRSASKALRGLAAEMDKTAAHGAKLGDGISASHGKIAGGLGKLGSGIAMGIGAGMVGAAATGAAAIADFATGSVSKFAQLEDASGAAGVIFGSSMGTIIKQSEAAASTLGMSKSQVIDAANTFGVFGKSAGLSGESLAGFSTQMTSLAGDMASFRGTSPERAIEAIGAALRGETEPIRAYGVMLDDASLRQEALAQGLISTTDKALTPQQKVLAAQALILKQTSDAQGDFARTSDSTANTQKRLSASLENVQAALGEKLAPMVTAAAEGLLGFMDNAAAIASDTGLADWATGLGEVLSVIGDGLMALGEIVLPVFAGVLSAVGDGIAWLTRQAAGLMRELGKVPGFGWATDVADGLDKMADGAEKAAAGIRALPDKVAQIRLEADLKGAKEAQTELAALPDVQTTIAAVKGDPKGAIEVKAKLDAIIDKSVKAVAHGNPTGATEVKNRMNELRDKYVTAVARGDARGAQAALDTLNAIAARNGTVSVITTRIVTENVTIGSRSTMGGLTAANGGIFSYYANGGVEDHRAQIAPAGAWRVWAEPETGGEAYLPLSPAKRAATIPIAKEAVRRLGGAAYFGSGGIVGGSSEGGGRTEIVFQVAPGADPHSFGRAVRDALRDLARAEGRAAVAY